MIRHLTATDLDALVRLNNEADPAVNALPREGLAELLGWAVHPLAVDDDGGLAAFVVALGPGLPYRSENYGFFSSRFDDFVYVDRVVVAPRARRRGLASCLYQAVADASAAPVMLCEVNLSPPNPESLAFHASLGFTEIGRQHTTGGQKEVVLLEKPLPRR